MAAVKKNIELKKNVQQALSRYAGLFSAAEYQQLREALQEEPDTAIRINLLRHTPTEFSRIIQDRYDWSLKQIPFCSSGFWVENGDDNISTCIEHRLADFYIQEAASMLPAELFDFSNYPEPLILDMAASPGGKTTHLADLSGDQGFIVANDASRRRIPILQLILQYWGVINQAVTCLNGAEFGKLYANTFDLVLLDAPCSMENLYHTASHPMRSVSPRERERLANRQRYLLSSAIQAVKPGGQIVYATCTLAPEEDESVLSQVIENMKEIVQVDDVSQRLPIQAPGMTTFSGMRFSSEMHKAVRLWPHLLGTSGFFCARLHKQEASPANDEDINLNRNIAINKIFSQLNQKEKNALFSFYLEKFGFALEQFYEENDLEIRALGTDILLVPNSLLKVFRDLPILSVGMPVAKQIRDQFQPAHAFAMRFGNHFTRGTMILPQEHTSAWMHGSDILGFKPSDRSTGEYVSIRDTMGRNLGLAKVLDKRLKNLLPSRIF